MKIAEQHKDILDRAVKAINLEKTSKTASMEFPTGTSRENLIALTGIDPYADMDGCFLKMIDILDVDIHGPNVPKMLGIEEEEARLKFGFLLDAFDYGAPPHAGIALGLDRLVMLLAGMSNIREVIAFPKTASGMCPLTGAPTPVPKELLDELGMKKIE